MEAEVCVRNKGGKGGHHACMNEHVTASCVIGAESAFSSVFVSVSEKKKREAELSPGPPARFHEWLQQGETVPHCQVIWQKTFFTPPHVKFINISPSIFFPFTPQNVFRSGFLAKLFPAEA